MNTVTPLHPLRRSTDRTAKERTDAQSLVLILGDVLLDLEEKQSVEEARETILQWQEKLLQMKVEIGP